MTPAAWVILIVALAAIVIAGFLAYKLRRSREIRSHFGPEYDYVVQERGSTSRAEKELADRTRRVDRFHIRPLSQAETDRFAAEWRSAQASFVDDPRGAVAAGGKLLHEAMRERGYPVGVDFDQRVGDLSVNYPNLVEHYRAAHTIAVRDSRGEAGTEDLRTAMMHYRALFEDMLERRVAETDEVRR